MRRVPVDLMSMSVTACVQDPIVLGVKVKDGILKIGTPICVPAKQQLMIGRVSGIEKNHISVQEAKAGEEVAVKIDSGHMGIQYGRHFSIEDELVSKVRCRLVAQASVCVCDHD